MTEAAIRAGVPMSADDEPLLSVRGATVRYANGGLGISGVSLEVGRGKIVALLGANGAGKSSTVRAITGFVRTERAKVIEGTIGFDGRDITNCEPHRVAWFGAVMVPERRKVFPYLSVADNLAALGHLPRKSEREAAFDRIFEMFPMLAQRQRELAGRLSGGQQQMLALARGLLTEPKLLVIDEMTLGLHTSLHPILSESVERVAATGTSVLIVEEGTALALRLASYCYLLRSGTLVDEGDAQHFEDPDVLSAGYA